jgi:hypothetical protein
MEVVCLPKVVYISSIYNENIKRNNEPLYDKKHLLFEFSLMLEVWHYIMGRG